MNVADETHAVIDTLTHVQKFSGKSILIKLGGSILHDDALIRTLCEDLVLLRAAGIKIVIVHGGSKAINAALQQYDIDSEFLHGLRVTSKAAMNIIEMVLCGQINQVLVRKINALGVHAVGLSGADSSMLHCDYYSQEHGYVGEIIKVNPQAIQGCLDTQVNHLGIIPIIAPVGVDDKGNALNINADWAASKIAMALGIGKLIYLTDQDGIKTSSGEVASELSTAHLHAMIESGEVRDGMLTKVNTILHALELGIPDIHIINGMQPHVLLTELFTTQGVGTLCKQFMHGRGVTV